MKQIGFTYRLVFIGLLLVSALSYSQTIKSSVDTTSIRIGEKLLYTLSVEVDSNLVVLFPEGQTFVPLEMISKSKTDTLRKQALFELITTYGLTQFDSGVYAIPRQPVQIGDEIKFSDSLLVRVNPVVIDTTKQGLYDIKPFIEVPKSRNLRWLWYVLGIIFIGAAIFWVILFIKQRKKNDNPHEQLEPFERAKQSLLSIAEASAEDHDGIKKYYSHLTFVLKSYLESKVYDHALESTTEELVGRLRLIRDGGHLHISDAVLDNITRVLQRSDLVKFAKSLPEKELLKMDWQTFDIALTQINDGIPEPTEEELARDLAYQQEKLRLEKLRQRKILLIATGSLPFLAFIVFAIWNGPKYAWDTVTFDKNKRLLETQYWITSEYGAPGMTVSTPLVLYRTSNPNDLEVIEGQKTSVFKMTDTDMPMIELKSTQIVDSTKALVDIPIKLDAQFKQWESLGVENIFEKRETITTPLGAQGYKVYGSAQWDNGEKVGFNLIYFTSENKALQELILVWPENDNYAVEMINRIVESIELIKKEE